MFLFKYDKDSTRSGGKYSDVFCPKCSSKGDDESYFQLIRLDVIAIDNITKDTICQKSYLKDELDQDNFIINVDRTKVPLANMTSSIRLLIKSGATEYVYKTNSIMAIKTSKGKVEGKLKSFNNKSFVLVDEKGNEQTVLEKDLVGIKGCGPLIASGPYFNMFNHCNYDRLDKVNFKVATQIFNSRKNEWTWQEVK